MKKILSLLLSASVMLSAFSFVMPAYASTEAEPLINYIYENDFSDITDAKDYRHSASISSMISIYDSATETLASGYELTNDGTLKITKAGEYSGLKIKGKDAEGNIPKLVLSYRIKPLFTRNDAYYHATVKDENGTSNIALYNHTINGGKGIYAGMTSGRAWEAGNKVLDVASFDGSTWYDITIVYDNDASKYNNRDIYVNGDYKGTFAALSSSALAGYNYAYTGDVNICNYFNPKTGDYIEFDDFKAYAYPGELKYELASATAEEVTLNFNMFPDEATVIPGNFTVKTGDTEINPDSVSISPDNAKQVILTFNNGLKAGTPYTVSAAGLTAGSSATDVADTIALSDSPEFSFTVAAKEIEWSPISEIFSFDYENQSTDKEITNTADQAYESDLGFYKIGAGGLYKIEEVDGNKSLTMQQNSTSATTSFARILPRKANFSSGNAYAVEMKIKTDFSKDPENAVFDSRRDSGWGLQYTTLNNGVIYNDNDLTESVGTYKDGEWITLKNVYYSTPVTIDGTDYLRRDVYINGQFAKTLYDSWATFGNSVNGGANLSVTFRIRGKDTTVNSEGKVYIDYIRVYKTADSLAAKLASAENVDTSFINLQFNSTPVQADLTGKIYIADENGVKVSDIAVPEYVNGFNADGYAANVKLWFVNRLENGKTYKLIINNISDIMGKNLYQEETFVTKPVPEADGLTLSGGIATVNINEYSEPLTLIVAGYEVIDNVEQMIKVVNKTITATGTFSTEEAVTADIVKAFLWKGTKPVISAAE